MSLLGLPAPFLVAALAIELTPGPNMAYLAMIALQRGRAAGMAAVAGVTVGLAAYLAATVAGLAPIVLAQPWIYDGLRWAGVFYLLYLALEAWRPATPQSADGIPGKAALFRRGLIVNLLNPKAAIFYIALLPAFIDPAKGAIAGQALRLGCAHLIIAIIIHSGIVFGAGAGRSHLARVTHGKGLTIVNRTFAVLLVGVAVWVAWATERT